jgi:hypothetical protein
MLHRI